jgi:hypothetical protein
MFRSLTSGEVIDPRWLRFSFPSTWHYDVLRGLDYLRSAGIEPDERIAEAIEIVVKRRHQNGRWPLNILHPDRIAFHMERGVGKASYWKTLRCLRVLDWYGKREYRDESEASGSHIRTGHQTPNLSVRSADSDFMRHATERRRGP